MKMTAPRTLRDATRRVFEGPLGCKRQSPNDTIDLFGFEDGGNIGVDYVDPAQALSPEQHKAAGTWIELAVDDEQATAKALEASEGVRAFSYFTPHRYFQLPAGQVFRLQR